MKIGNKRIVYDQTFLIPKGEKVSGDVSLEVFSQPITVPASSTIPQEIQIPAVPTRLNLYVEIFPDHSPPEENANRLSWRFESEPRPAWYLTLFGPFPGLLATTTEFVDFAVVGGKKLGFLASFSATPNVCDVHLQLLMEE